MNVLHFSLGHLEATGVGSPVDSKKLSGISLALSIAPLIKSRLPELGDLWRKAAG
jgi:hypothetical protein